MFTLVIVFAECSTFSSFATKHVNIYFSQPWVLKPVLFGQTVNFEQIYMKLKIISHQTIWLIRCMNYFGKQIGTHDHKWEHKEKTMDSSHNALMKSKLLTEC